MAGRGDLFGRGFIERERDAVALLEKADDTVVRAVRRERHGDTVGPPLVEAIVCLVRAVLLVAEELHVANIYRAKT